MRVISSIVKITQDLEFIRDENDCKEKYKFQLREVLTLNIAHILCVYEVLLISMQVAKVLKRVENNQFCFHTRIHLYS